MPRPDPRDFLPLSPVVLHVLLALAAGERHGYAIAREVEETTGGQVRMGPGTLYGSIQRMLAAGLIDAARRATPSPMTNAGVTIASLRLDDAPSGWRWSASRVSCVKHGRATSCPIRSRHEP